MKFLCLAGWYWDPFPFCFYNAWSELLYTSMNNCSNEKSWLLLCILSWPKLILGTTYYQTLQHWNSVTKKYEYNSPPKKYLIYQVFKKKLILFEMVHFQLILSQMNAAQSSLAISSAAHEHSHSRVCCHVVCLTCHLFCNHDKCKQP